VKSGSLVCLVSGVVLRFTYCRWFVEVETSLGIWGFVASFFFSCAEAGIWGSFPGWADSLPAQELRWRAALTFQAAEQAAGQSRPRRLHQSPKRNKQFSQKLTFSWASKCRAEAAPLTRPKAGVKICRQINGLLINGSKDVGRPEAKP